MLEWLIAVWRLLRVQLLRGKAGLITMHQPIP